MLFNACHSKLTKHGHSIKWFILDNECPNNLKLSILKTDYNFKLVLPHHHIRNATERAIWAANTYLLAGLATCDPYFLITEQDCLLRQSEITLNLLRTSRINLKLSSWTYINGVFELNKTPLAPPRSHIIMHSKAGQRIGWAYHELEDFYVAPAPNH